MIISKLIELLERKKEKLGDVQVTMQATFLRDGYSSNDSKVMPDVFESTIESSYDYEGGEIGKRLRLFWQTD